MKSSIKKFFQKTVSGREILYQTKRLLGKLPLPDMDFPQLINLETSSLCNLSCVHCPPQQKGRSDQTRRLNHMKPELFYALMDEIDRHGSRRITLHKDGEPLLHPKIVPFLQRVKKNQDHELYLTTNAHNLTPEIGQALLDARVDIVNFSLGAASSEFYKKVRGSGFERVIRQTTDFAKACARHSGNAPRLIAQMIRLPEYAECEEEIAAFTAFWKKLGVEVQIWDKLTWGTYAQGKTSAGARMSRYPCYSLWESMTVNSDGLVSACCMDWRQDLIVGNANRKSLERIWKASALTDLRRRHMNQRTDELPLCEGCNYWSWQSRLEKYSL